MRELGAEVHARDVHPEGKARGSEPGGDVTLDPSAVEEHCT